jgi:hypothetical protein
MAIWRIAVPLQQWLHTRASILRHMQIACLVIIRECKIYAVFSYFEIIYINFTYLTKIYLSIQQLVLFPQTSYVHVVLYCNNYQKLF